MGAREMMGRIGALVLLAAVSLTASWMLGYHEGQQNGAFYLLRQMEHTYELDRQVAMDYDRDRVCNEIRRYKESVARDLDENTEICGWPDMDGPEKSD